MPYAFTIAYNVAWFGGRSPVVVGGWLSLVKCTHHVSHDGPSSILYPRRSVVGGRRSAYIAAAFSRRSGALSIRRSC
jgi:hypothetical protein